MAARAAVEELVSLCASVDNPLLHAQDCGQGQARLVTTRAPQPAAEVEAIPLFGGVEDPGRSQSRSGTPWASVRNWAEPAMIMMPSTTPHRPTMNPRPSVKMPRTRVRTSWMTATLV